MRTTTGKPDFVTEKYIFLLAAFKLVAYERGKHKIHPGIQAGSNMNDQAG
jgi:hypothetical protein